jgi:hypothetical protein
LIAGLDGPPAVEKRRRQVGRLTGAVAVVFSAALALLARTGRISWGGREHRAATPRGAEHVNAAPAVPAGVRLVDSAALAETGVDVAEAGHPPRQRVGGVGVVSATRRLRPEPAARRQRRRPEDATVSAPAAPVAQPGADDLVYPFGAR